MDTISHVDPDHKELSVWNRPDVLLGVEDASRLKMYLRVGLKAAKVQQAILPMQEAGCDTLEQQPSSRCKRQDTATQSAKRPSNLQRGKQRNGLRSRHS
jgi:hypothetical protein